MGVVPWLCRAHLPGTNYIFLKAFAMPSTRDRTKYNRFSADNLSIQQALAETDSIHSVVAVSESSPELPKLGLPIGSLCDNEPILELTRRVCYGGGDIRAGWPGAGVPQTSLEKFKPFAEWALAHWAMYYGFYPSLKKSESLILDVGCGMGYATYNLGLVFPQSQIVGVDLDPNSILYANKFNALRNVKFACGDAFKLEASKVDVVFAVDILEHLPADLHVDFTEKCMSLVKNDGMVCMTTPNALDEADEPFGHIGLLNRTRAPRYFRNFQNRLIEFGYYDNKMLLSGDIDSYMISEPMRDFDKADKNRSHFRYILR